MLNEIVTANPQAWATLALIAGALTSWLSQARRGLAPWSPITYWLIDDKPLGWGTLGVLGTTILAIWQVDMDGANGVTLLQAWFASGLVVDALIQPGPAKTASDALNKLHNKASGFIRWPLLPVLVALALLSGGMMGCAGLQELAGDTLKVDANLSPPAQIAQSVINEANLTLTASANVIGNNAQSGIMAKVDAQAALDEVKRLREQVKTAQALLELGDISSAQSQAALINRLATALHKRVAAEARKQP